MNLYENIVAVNDEKGRAFICTLDHKFNEIIGRLDRYRKIPNKLEELSEHERRSCTRFFGNTYRGQRMQANVR